MFWYILFSVVPIFAITLMIISHKRKFELLNPYVIFFATCIILLISGLTLAFRILPSTEYSRLIETLPIEQLNSDNANKYILIDGEEYSFKAISTNEYGIEEKKLFTTKQFYTYFKFDPSIERGEPILQIYEPTTSFWYPAAWLGKDGQHNFYVITLPSQDVIELKLNYWKAYD